jgi:bifunctional non-homologous end joining protein LigD
MGFLKHWLTVWLWRGSFSILALSFISPMLLRPVKTLPRGERWCYELKFDGFRGIAIKEHDHVRLLSRNGNDLSKRFERIVQAVRDLPVKSLILDGEIVCLDLEGKPCFEDLQSFAPEREPFLFYYAFDLLHQDGKSLIREPLVRRKEALCELLVKGRSPLRCSEFLDANPDDLIQFTQAHKLEGIVAKDRNSLYEPGKRSGRWMKFKTYQEREFLIGGFLADPEGVRSIAVGFRRGGDLVYAAKLEVYLPTAERRGLEQAFLKLRMESCPFEKLPTRKAGDTWSVGLTNEEASSFVWLHPRIKANVRFTEWTRAGLLRHAMLAKVQS